MKWAGKLKLISRVDPFLVFSTLALISLGTIMVFSASSLSAAEHFDDNTHFLKRHLLHLCVGVGLMTVLFLVQVRALRRLAIPALGVTVALLLFTLFSAAGVEAKHATRWLSLGFVTLQPAELAKPLMVLYVAAYLAKKEDRITDFASGLLPLLVTVGSVLLLILRQPDFGTTVVLGLTVALMLFTARARIWHLAALGMSAMVAAWFLVHGAAYRLTRLVVFLNPWEDPQGAGFQIIQSFIAFQRGGWLGQGLGDGSQKLLYLPEAHTDFIYSVIGEELGLLGSLGVMLLFALFVFQGFRLASAVADTFASQLAYGLTALIGLQAFFNMAVAMGLVPTKGLTLPLVSYGGSSLVTTMGSVAILLSLSCMVPTSKQMAKRRSS